MIYSAIQCYTVIYSDIQQYILNADSPVLGEYGCYRSMMCTPVPEAGPEVLEEGAVDFLERALGRGIHAHVQLGDGAQLCIDTVQSPHPHATTQDRRRTVDYV